MSLRRAFCISVIALALGACGGSEPKIEKAAPPVPKGIFISVKDCAEVGKLSGDECGKVIDAAIASHQKQAKSYASLKQCSSAVGADRCEKTVDGGYRQRLQAFYVVMGKPPVAEPLYPPKAKKTFGFQSPTQPAIDAADESLIVSAAAMKLAHQNAALP